jgi:hypothetical protein
MMPIWKKIFSFPTLTLFVALGLSIISAWYSILGLTAIFAAAVIPIIIMGSSLEVAKVITTVWLHRYWNRASWVLKIYLVPAVVALALLTSMGVFGFLSKAHSDQGLVSGNVQAKLLVIDEKIKTQRENIDTNKKALTQMDAQVDQSLGRTDTLYGVNRAVQIRRQQRRERTVLQNEISDAQKIIATLNEDRAPIAAENRKVEAEVGPIKYIAALIYGDNPNSTLLERSVRWVIILIVLVFDPLALSLVIASNKSYKWLTEDYEKTIPKTKVETKVEPEPKAVDPAPIIEPVEETIEDPVEEIIEEPVISADADITIDYVEPVVTSAPIQIITENVTTEHPLQETENNNYVLINGKHMHREAASSMHPELFRISADNGVAVNTSFGTQFPAYATKGDIFVRVDVLPNRVFKFYNKKWVDINKEQSDTYLLDDQYIQFLLDKVQSGEYDVELLTENEKSQIEALLSK